MDFAPYQSETPDTSRQSLNFNRSLSPPGLRQQGGRAYSPLPPSSPPPVLPTHQSGRWGGGIGDRETVNQFETSLPIRLDWEAVMAYILLPPAGGVFLLITEHKSDYVRFHAWQSALLFAFLVVLHVIFSFTKIISFILLAVDLVLIAFLSLRAYKDADTLDRCCCATTRSRRLDC